MANPIFVRTNEFRNAPAMPAPAANTLQTAYEAPAATSRDTGRMSYEGTITRTAGMLVLLGMTAAVGWVMANPGLTIAAAVVGLVLALVNSFKREPAPALIIAYAAVEGFFLGGISVLIERQMDVPGVALQALLATGATFAVCLWLYRSGRVRMTQGLRKFFMIGAISYGVFCVINLGLMWIGGMDGFGLRSEVTIAGIPLGIFIGLFAVVLASISLISDFDFIERGVVKGLPAKFEWTAAFGLVVTLVWLYIEFLRILAILRGR